MTITEQLRRDESIRLKPYMDCCGKYWRLCTCAVKGKLTIGYGRNLDDTGIFPGEADFFLTSDIERAHVALVNRLPWTVQLGEVRFSVLLNMAYNMGIGGLVKFSKMLSHVECAEYAEAADEMLNSTWAKQVGPRATRLATQMCLGTWQ